MVHTLKPRLLRYRSIAHRIVFTRSRGRLLSRWGGLPVVLLTTTSRSGQKRQTILVTPAEQDGRIAVVASNGGAHRHPIWFLHLRERPDVEVLVRRRLQKMVARQATADEKARLWREITERSPAYARYQTLTDREIPVVLLEAQAPEFNGQSTG